MAGSRRISHLQHRVEEGGSTCYISCMLPLPVLLHGEAWHANSISVHPAAACPAQFPHCSLAGYHKHCTPPDTGSPLLELIPSAAGDQGSNVCPFGAMLPDMRNQPLILLEVQWYTSHQCCIAPAAWELERGLLTAGCRTVPVATCRAFSAPLSSRGPSPRSEHSASAAFTAHLFCLECGWLHSTGSALQLRPSLPTSLLGPHQRT